MHCQEIMHAVATGDANATRDAFRALVDFPHEAQIEAAGPRPLAVALRAVCEALAADNATMPRSTCDALEAPHGSPYASDPAAAKQSSMRLVERYKRHFEKRVSR